MNTPKFGIGPLSVLCILGLVFGRANALALTATDTTSNTGAGQCQRPSPENTIRYLEEKGVDVTEAEADFERRDTSAVKAWLDSYFHAHKGEMPSCHPCGEHPTEIPSGTSSESNP